MSKKTINHGQAGYSLMEITVAVGITAIVALIGAQAFQYFNKQTKGKITELNTIQQFNLLTKDMLSFSESAGLSTLYFNMPVRLKNCEEGRPCVRHLKSVPVTDCPAGQTCPPRDQWSALTTEEIPAVVKDEQCLQFYRDSHGKPVDKPAFVNTSTATELAGTFRNFNYTSSGIEAFHTWPLVDETSAPLLIVKLKNVGDYFSLNSAMSIGRDFIRSNNGDQPAFRAAVFDSSMSASTAAKYVGTPMLFYGSQNQGHFAYYYAASILPCRDNREACLQEILTNIYDADAITPNIEAGITDQSFVIGLRPFDMTTSYFSEAVQRTNVPDECKYSWAARQDASQYFFPNGLMSIWNPAVPDSDINPDTRNYYNPTSYHKYAAFSMPDGDRNPSFGQLLPVDFIRYGVEKIRLPRNKTRLDLVAHTWHETEEKKLTKITNLTNTFWFTRKLGSNEFGVDYSPKAERDTTTTTGVQP